MNPLHFIYKFLEQKAFQNSKKIIANSYMVKEQIINTYNIDPKKIEVVYNGLPLKEKVNFSGLKNEFNLKDEKVILYVGSGFKRKGVKEALDIVSKLQNNFKFIVVGKEKKMQFYKDYAKKLGIKNKVIFTGPRGDVDKFYSMSDIFLFPTRYEPFSNVVLEAIMYENVVFTTKQNGAHEILEEEFIMNSSNDFSIVKKIDHFLSDSEQLIYLKKKQSSIINNFSIDKNIEETLKVIRQLL